MLPHAHMSVAMPVRDNDLYSPKAEGSISDTDLDAALPLTCPSGSSCTAGGFMNTGYSWACCDEIQCYGNYEQCVNYGDSLCVGLDDRYCSLIFTSILYW